MTFFHRVSLSAYSKPDRCCVRHTARGMEAPQVVRSLGKQKTWHTSTVACVYCCIAVYGEDACYDGGGSPFRLKWFMKDGAS